MSASQKVEWKDAKPNKKRKTTKSKNTEANEHIYSQPILDQLNFSQDMDLDYTQIGELTVDYTSRHITWHHTETDTTTFANIEQRHPTDTARGYAHAARTAGMTWLHTHQDYTEGTLLIRLPTEKFKEIDTQLDTMKLKTHFGKQGLKIQITVADKQSTGAIKVKAQIENIHHEEGAYMFSIKLQFDILTALQLPLPDLDLCADTRNATAKKFIGKIWYENAIGIDALSIGAEILADYETLNCNPPFLDNFIPRVYQLLVALKQRAYLVLPKWKNNKNKSKHTWWNKIHKKANICITIPDHIDIFNPDTTDYKKPIGPPGWDTNMFIFTPNDPDTPHREYRWSWALNKLEPANQAAHKWIPQAMLPIPQEPQPSNIENTRRKTTTNKLTHTLHIKFKTGGIILDIHKKLTEAKIIAPNNTKISKDHTGFTITLNSYNTMRTKRNDIKKTLPSALRKLLKINHYKTNRTFAIPNTVSATCTSARGLTATKNALESLGHKTWTTTTDTQTFYIRCKTDTPIKTRNQLRAIQREDDDMTGTWITDITPQKKNEHLQWIQNIVRTCLEKLETTPEDLKFIRQYSLPESTTLTKDKLKWATATYPFTAMMTGLPPYHPSQIDDHAHSLIVTYWNCGGARDFRTKPETPEMGSILKGRPDILIMAETHTEHPPKLNGFTCIANTLENTDTKPQPHLS